MFIGRTNKMWYDSIGSVETVFNSAKTTYTRFLEVEIGKKAPLLLPEIKFFEPFSNQ